MAQRGFQSEGGVGGLQGGQTIAELASKRGLCPNLITKRKQPVVEGPPGLFESKPAEADKGREAEIRELHAKDRPAGGGA